MSNLSPTETNIYFYFVPRFEETEGSLTLNLDVVHIGLKTETNLFYINLFLIAAAFLQVFILLVAVFTPVDDTNNRWFSLGGDFNKV